jgi:RHS repeat-associated protein
VISEYNAYWHQGKVSDYMFNAKEKDEESGMYYYSARYYAPPVFISRDPAFEEYPTLSPYCYVANNPVNVIDPDGKRIFAHDRTSKQYMKSYFKDQFGSSRMFRFNSQKELKINQGKFNKTISSANEYQKTLLQGMEKAIGREERAVVRINKNSDKFTFKDPLPVGYDNNSTPIYDKREPTITWNEGGFTADDRPNIPYLMVGVNHSVADKSLYSSNGPNVIIDNNTSSPTGASASSVFFHEVLDEFLNYSCGENKSMSPCDYQNNALKNKGFLPRNEEDH